MMTHKRWLTLSTLMTCIALLPALSLANHHGAHCDSDYQSIPFSKINKVSSGIFTTKPQENGYIHDFTYATCQAKLENPKPGCKYIQWCYPFANNKGTLQCADTKATNPLLCTRQAKHCYGNSSHTCRNANEYPAPDISTICGEVTNWNISGANKTCLGEI